MTHNSAPTRDLQAIARQAMLDAGFAADFAPDVLAEVTALRDAPAPGRAERLADLRGLLWSSIDNPESRDLDQVEVAERLTDGDIRVLVGIADVDSRVPAGSATDRRAMQNTTSVYTGVMTFPMLPERLSTDLTSLLEGVDRLAMVVEYVVAEDGTLRSSAVSRAWVRNHAKLDYESVGAWLEGGAPPLAVAGDPALEQQLRLHDEATERLRALRQRSGALDVETVEASLVTSNGAVVDLAVRHKNRARYLVESLMIAANSVIASFLEDHGSPTLERIVRTPERWPRIVELAASYGERLPAEPDSRALAGFLAQRKQADPEHFADLSLAVVKLLGSGEYALVRPNADDVGHFGLAVQDYTHATAPNRRYADLITQRLLKAALAEAPVPYNDAELEAIAARCNERGRAANKVERRMRKVAAAALMAGRIGQRFEAIVTGASAKGTYVRLVAPPVEGRIVRGEQGLDVGDKTRVRLVATDPAQGFIDFARV
jgi:exoribonuclease-2